MAWPAGGGGVACGRRGGTRAGAAFHAGPGVERAGRLVRPAWQLDAAALAASRADGTHGSTQALPYTWPRAVLPGGAEADRVPQVTWVQVSLDGVPPAPGGVYLYLPRWQTIGRIAVYGDDRLLYRSTGDLVWNGFNHPLWVALDAEGQAPLPRLLRLRIDSRPSAGGAVSSLWVGPAPALLPGLHLREALQSQIAQLISVAVLGLGLFALAVWLLRRGEIAYLLFALYALLLGLRSLHFHMGLQPLPIASAWFGWMTVNAVNALLVTWYFFVTTLVPRAPRWPGRSLLGLLLLSSLVTLPLLSDDPRAAALAPLSYLLTICAGGPAVLLLAWVAWRRGAREGLLASAVGVIDLPVAIHDWLMQNYLVGPESYYAWPVSAMARLLVFIYILLRRYVGAIDEVERANLRLAERLAAREAELSASYEQLRQVQQRQTLSRERQRLMQDIHDGMGSQLMSALKVAESGRLSEAQMALVLRECIDDLKLTVDSLEPVEADLLLVLATLRYRLAPRLSDAGLAIRWEVVALPPLPWLDPRCALHVLRILQEGISNVLQHAQATELRVATALDGEAGVYVTLTDNGRGFDTATHAEGGRGLSNMVRRADLIGGRVSWEAVPGGTCCRVWLPQRRELEGAE
ncbi:MAG: sensor histidine kinase [Rhodoferax sp.]|uniref:sensor histidine kinase n=1 Tax=Rhodoferax sp. TaxID=50421 RepID=UPI00326337F3